MGLVNEAQHTRIYIANLELKIASSRGNNTKLEAKTASLEAEIAKLKAANITLQACIEETPQSSTASTGAQIVQLIAQRQEIASRFSEAQDSYLVQLRRQSEIIDHKDMQIAEMEGKMQARFEEADKSFTAQLHHQNAIIDRQNKHIAKLEARMQEPKDPKLENGALRQKEDGTDSDDATSLGEAVAGMDEGDDTEEKHRCMRNRVRDLENDIDSGSAADMNEVIERASACEDLDEKIQGRQAFSLYLDSLMAQHWSN